MKKLLFFIISMISIASYSKNNGTEINLQTGITIYKLKNPTIDFNIKQYAPPSSIVKTTNKTKKWFILKYTNVGNDKSYTYFNAIVIAKSKNEKNLYIVKYEDLGENRCLIDSINKKIKDLYEQADSIDKQYIIDTLYNYTKYINVTEEEILKYNKIKEYKLDSISNTYLDGGKKIYNNLSQKLKHFVDIINIKNSNVYHPNSAGGCDVYFVYTNLKNKSIKYLYFNADFYNSVDDKIPCEINGFAYKRCKDTGYINQNETGGGLFENVIYNNSTSYMIINSIRIVYKDNTAYTINLSKNEYISLMKYFHYINNIDYVDNEMKKSVCDLYKELKNKLKVYEDQKLSENKQKLLYHNNRIKVLTDSLNKILIGNPEY